MGLVCKIIPSFFRFHPVVYLQSVQEHLKMFKILCILLAISICTSAYPLQVRRGDSRIDVMRIPQLSFGPSSGRSMISGSKGIGYGNNFFSTIIFRIIISPSISIF